MAIQFWFEFASTYSYPAACTPRTPGPERARATPAGSRSIHSNNFLHSTVDLG